MGTLGLTDYIDQITSPPRIKESPRLREPNEHDKLVEIGRNYMACKSHVVVTETTGYTEEPDILAFGAILKGEIIIEQRGKMEQRGTFLLECKASRADFISDKRKMFRRNPGYGMGEFRYFFIHRGLLKPEEIPEGWGLIETTGVRGKIIKASKYWDERAIRAEFDTLISVIRRIGVSAAEGLSIRVYNPVIKNKNKCTVTVGCDTEGK